MAGRDHLSRFAEARVARLATIRPDGTPHIVPITFAIESDDVVTAIDHKPKSTARLQRLINIEVNPVVSLLADAWSEDWSRLWWIRIDGTATIRISDEPGLGALVSKYEHYRSRKPEGPVVRIAVSRTAGWSAEAR